MKMYECYKQGCCAKCGSSEIKYNEHIFDGEGVTFYYTCPVCGSEGRERYSLELEENTVEEVEEEKTKQVETKEDGIWAHICPKCGASLYTECSGEDRIYNGDTAQVREYYHCSKCNLDFSIVSEMVYKYHTIDE